MTDEAKLRVAALRWAHLHEDCNDADDTCPVQDECLRCTNVLCNIRTAANLIVSLSAELEQVKRERDAAVEDLRGACAFCAHVRDCLVTGCSDDMGEACKQCPCKTCFHDSNWQWRGVKEESDERTEYGDNRG